MPKQRLDILLVERNFCDSRQEAQRCIGAGEVKVNDRVIDKAGTKIDISAAIELKAKPLYVSRGGEKLHQALVHQEQDMSKDIIQSIPEN